MKSISVDVSPKQRSRLRNGHPVRLKKGEGLILLVHPERFDVMSRTFKSGKSRTVSLTPEELLANMKISPEVHQERQSALEELQTPTAPLAKAAEVEEPKGAVVGGRIVEGTIVGSGLSVNPPSRIYVSNAGGTRGGYRIQSTVGATELVKHLDQIGRQVGENYGAQLKASLGSAAQNMATSDMTELGIRMGRDNMLTVDVPHNTLSGTGLYAGRSVMFGRGRREVSSVGVNGNLLSRQRVLPPALQSQPYGAFFSQSAQMPPAYQTR